MKEASKYGSENSILNTAVYFRAVTYNTEQHLQKQLDEFKTYLLQHGDIDGARYYIETENLSSNDAQSEFKKLVKSIFIGDISCMIVKSFDLIGKDRSESYMISTKLLPLLNVRVISIDDNYDSSRTNIEETMKEVTFPVTEKSKQVTSGLDVLKSEGAFIGSYAPYGYLKSEQDKHKLVVDRAAADIVKRIFDMAVNGATLRAIANTLTLERRSSPDRYHKSKNIHVSGTDEDSWNVVTVKKILQSQVYLGHMVQGSKSASKCGYIVKNTHKPIISKELFDKAQQKVSERSKKYFECHTS